MRNIRIIVLFASLFAFVSTLNAQRLGDAVYFSSLPQASQYNPAFHGNNSFYLSIPTLGKFGLNFNTSGFVWHDFVNQHPDYKDSLRLDFEGFDKKLKDNNYFDLGFTDEILGFGFKIGKNHFSFDVLLNVETKLSFSKGLFDLIVYGTDYKDKHMNIFDKKLLDVNAYVSYALDYSREINNKLTVGGNLKMYMGLANVSSKKTNVHLDFRNDKIQTLSDVEINTANSFIHWYMTGDNLFKDGSVENDDFKLSLNNMGFGFDVGASYKLNEDMQLSFSLVDIGYIKWKSNANTVRSKHPNTPVEFSGIRTSYDNIGDDIDQYLDDIVDSLKYAFDLETVENSGYTTMVPTKVYLGYSWEFFSHNYLNALYKGRFIGGGYENSLMLNYSFKMKYFQLSLGNTFASKFFNPNVFISLADIFYFGASFASSLNAADASGLSFQFGFNVALKSKTEKKTQVEDTPKQDVSFLEK